MTWSAFFQAAVHLFYKRSPIRVHIFQIELHIFEKSCIREFSTMRWWGWQIKGATLFATPFRGMLWNLSLKLGGVIRNLSLELGGSWCYEIFHTRNSKWKKIRSGLNTMLLHKRAFNAYRLCHSRGVMKFITWVREVLRILSIELGGAQNLSSVNRVSSPPTFYCWMLPKGPHFSECGPHLKKSHVKNHFFWVRYTPFG